MTELTKCLGVNCKDDYMLFSFDTDKWVKVKITSVINSLKNYQRQKAEKKVKSMDEADKFLEGCE